MKLVVETWMLVKKRYALFDGNIQYSIPSLIWNNSIVFRRIRAGLFKEITTHQCSTL